MHDDICLKHTACFTIHFIVAARLDAMLGRRVDYGRYAFYKIL